MAAGQVEGGLFATTGARRTQQLPNLGRCQRRNIPQDVVMPLLEELDHHTAAMSASDRMQTRRARASFSRYSVAGRPLVRRLRHCSATLP